MTATPFVTSSRDAGREVLLPYSSAIVSATDAEWSFSLFDYQEQVISHPARNKWWVAGRRAGKSTTGAFWLLSGALKDHLEVGGGHSFVITPTYELGQAIFEKCLEIAPRLPNGMSALFEPDADVYKSPHSMIRVGNATIDFRSGEKPGNIVGLGLRRVLLDECALLQEDVWNYLRPMLIEYKAPSLGISSPRGRNWFYKQYLLGLQYGISQKHTASFKTYTYQNPRLEVAEIGAARQDMLTAKYKQEILAEFLRDGSGLFDRIVDCQGPASMKQPSVYGVDLARKVDATVIFGFDEDAHWSHFFRYEKIPWETQILLITRLSELTEQRLGRKALFVVDGTGVGDPVIAALEKNGVNVMPYIFTQQSKLQLVENWALAVQQKRVVVPSPQDHEQGLVFQSEHEVFDAKLSPLGIPSYNAPEGAHDDCVIAAALAWHGLHGAVSIGAVNVGSGLL